MRHGFVKTAAATPDIRVADVEHNREEICRLAEEAAGAGAKIIVFPELCLTGYTCGDLFHQDILLSAVKQALRTIQARTEKLDALMFIGMPVVLEGKLYNTAAVLNHGRLLGLISKTHLPNYSEFYEMRQFTAGPEEARLVTFDREQVWFGPGLLFQADAMEELIVSGEICEDLWAPEQPSTKAAVQGAVIIANCSASNEVVGKDRYRSDLVAGQSARLTCAYIYANAGEGESTTDVVFGGRNLIAENGTILSSGERFTNQTIYSEIDVHRLYSDRRRNTTFRMNGKERNIIPFTIASEEMELTRKIAATPFVPTDHADRAGRCEEILTIQAMGLKKRMAHTGCRNAVVGISGGLDSTLALIVTVKAFDMLGFDRSGIIAVTMPCFGTTDRTYQNACTLTKKLGAKLREVDIKEAVLTHFRDIGQSMDDHSVTYENGQARERTQVLMDIANQCGGLVIGTGDLSELALGWATYNGDHMSMYGVNASIPKTLVRHLVQFYEETCPEGELKEVLCDILDTPVSPELLPPKEGQIAQKTEDFVGPYELHDFILFYMLRFGYEPSKIYRLARYAFGESYDAETIIKWMKVFYRRFFAQQFKRSCLPDGPKVGSVALSPRGDWRMPSDACAAVWLDEVEKLQAEMDK